MILSYLVITFLFGLFAAYKYGRWYQHERDGLLSVMVFNVLFWPIVILIVLVGMPFYYAAQLGEKQKEKALEKERNQ